MPSDHISKLRFAKARVSLDEYQRSSETMERAIKELIVSSRVTIAQSRGLLDRVGRRLAGK